MESAERLVRRSAAMATCSCALTAQWRCTKRACRPLVCVGPPTREGKRGPSPCRSHAEGSCLALSPRCRRRVGQHGPEGRGRLPPPALHGLPGNKQHGLQNARLRDVCGLGASDRGFIAGRSAPPALHGLPGNSMRCRDMRDVCGLGAGCIRQRQKGGLSAAQRGQGLNGFSRRGPCCANALAACPTRHGQGWQTALAHHCTAFGASYGNTTSRRTIDLQVSQGPDACDGSPSCLPNLNSPKLVPKTTFDFAARR